MVDLGARSALFSVPWGSVGIRGVPWGSAVVRCARSPIIQPLSFVFRQSIVAENGRRFETNDKLGVGGVGGEEGRKRANENDGNEWGRWIRGRIRPFFLMLRGVPGVSEIVCCSCPPKIQPSFLPIPPFFHFGQ